MADGATSEAVVTAGLAWHTDEMSYNGGTRHFPLSKLGFGALDSFTIVSTTDPFPVANYFGTTAVSVGAGAVNTGVQRVTLASDDPLVVSGQLIDDAIVADDAAFTPATTKVMMAGFEFDDVATDSVNEGDSGAARMSANRCIYVNVRDNAGNERGLNVDTSGYVGVHTVTTVTAVTSITNALPAGTNAIGKLAANSGVDIGDVDVTSVIAGTGATNLGKAIDTAAGATDTGVAALAVRDDSLTTLTPVDGDWTPLRVDSTGQLWVTWGQTVYTTDAVAPASPTGIVSIVQRDDALSTLTPADADWAGPLRVNARGALWTREEATQSDDAAFTPGTSYVVPVAFQADETATDSVDEGDAGCARMTLDRMVRVTAELESTSIRAGTTKRTPTFAVVSAASAGDNTLVAAAGGSLKIRVMQLFLVATGGANTVRLESGASGTALTGQMDLTSDGQLSWPFSPTGWCETAANTLLNLELSAATSVAGVIGYITVD